MPSKFIVASCWLQSAFGQSSGRFYTGVGFGRFWLILAESRSLVILHEHTKIGWFCLILPNSSSNSSPYDDTEFEDTRFPTESCQLHIVTKHHHRSRPSSSHKSTITQVNHTVAQQSSHDLRPLWRRCWRLRVYEGVDSRAWWWWRHRMHGAPMSAFEKPPQEQRIISKALG